MNAKNFGEFYDQRVLRSQSSISIENPFPRFAIAPYKFVWGFFETIPSTSRVLDIGCGCGIHSTYFAQRANFVHGIDISQKSLDIALINVKKLNFDNKCLFENKDFLSFNSTQPEYDILFASGVLYYFDLLQVKEKIPILLKRGGVFCAIETVGNNQLINLFRKAKNYLFKHRDNRTIKNLFKIEDFELLASDFAFSKIYYFDFLTLFLRPIQNIPMLGNVLLHAARKIDYILLNKLGLRKLSFKMVLIASR